MSFDPNNAVLDEAPPKGFDPANAEPSETPIPANPIHFDASPPNGRFGADFPALYAGLDGLDARVGPEQRQAFSALDKNSKNPQEDRARVINQLYVENALGPELGPDAISKNWDSTKKFFAQHALGMTPSEKFSDVALYGAIAENYKAMQEPTLGGELEEAAEQGAPRLVMGPQQGKFMGVVAAAYNGLVEPFSHSLTTLPGGLGILAGGEANAYRAAAPEIEAVAKTIDGFFTGYLTKAYFEQEPQTKAVFQDPNSTFQDKATALTAQASTGLMAAAGALMTVHGAAPEALNALKGKAIEQVPATIVDEAGKIADPEKRAMAVEAANKIAETVGQPPVEIKTEPLDAGFKGTEKPLGVEGGFPGTKELLPIKGPEGDTYGIAARVTEQRAKAGKVEDIEPGEGIAPEASVEKGRQLLKNGASPETAVERFEKTGAIKADDIALARAEGERLAKKASAAADKYGTGSEQYREAAKADSDWLKRIKPMQTEWSRIGMAQQGETELDTGDFHSLRREFEQTAGRDFTPQEADKAQKIAKDVRKAEGDVDAAKGEVLDELKKKPATQDEVTADIWKRAKDYLESGEDDFDDIRHKIATDTGLPVSEVTKRLAGPKRIRVITNDMYSKMAQRRALVDQAKYWIKKQAMPGWERFLRQIPRIFFADKVFGHGTVGMITHAGINMFNPADWATYWPKFFEQYKLIGWHDQGAYHEMAMQDLQRDPYYVTARRAGLANAVNKSMDDYEKGAMGKIGLVGNRGFDALKIYRQARFSQEWAKTPASMRTPEYAKALADGINHATGYVKANFPTVANSVIFAPKLEGSRWAYLIGDPVKDGKTFANWSSASDGAKAAAIRNTKEKALIAGTYIGLLAANEGLLTATGSKQKINFTDPKKPDFLAFKAAGYQLGIISPMLGAIRYLVNMTHAALEERHGAEKKDTRFEEMVTLTGKYGRNKLSPFGGFVTDVAAQADYQNRPLPFSKDKPPAYLSKEGIGKYTYAEWLGEQFAPIPLEEAIKEVWTDQGMSEDRQKHWLGVIATMAVMGGTGARMQPDTEKLPPPPKAEKPKKHDPFQ